MRDEMMQCNAREMCKDFGEWRVLISLMSSMTSFLGFICKRFFFWQIIPPLN